MHDANTGRTYDYTKKGEHGKLVDSGIFLPKGAPEKYLDRQTLWNEIDQQETNANARFAREFEVSIPVGLNREQQIEVTKEFCKALADEGMIVDYAIHNPKADNSNPHIHILCSTRPIDEKTGKFSLKEKKIYALDADGNRIPVIDKNTGKQKIGARGRKIWKRTTVQTNPFNAKENIKKWRKQWEIVANNALERAGINSKIDCRSYEERGLNIIPCFGEGAEQYIRERGIDTIRDVRAPNEEIKQINTEVLETEVLVAKDNALTTNRNSHYLDYLDKLVTFNSYTKAPLKLTVAYDELNHDYSLNMAYAGATNKYIELSFNNPHLQTLYEGKRKYFLESFTQIRKGASKKSLQDIVIETYTPPKERELRTVVIHDSQITTIDKRPKPWFIYRYAGVVKELPQLAKLVARKSIRIVHDFVANIASLVKRKPVRLTPVMTKKFALALTPAIRLVRPLPTMDTQPAELMPRPKVRLASPLTATLAQLEIQKTQNNVQVPASKRTAPVQQHVYTPDTIRQPEPELQQSLPEKSPDTKPKLLNVAQYLQELERLLFENLYAPLRLKELKESATDKLYSYINDCADFIMQDDDLKNKLQGELFRRSDNPSPEDCEDACVQVLLEQVQGNVDKHKLNIPEYLSCCAEEVSQLNYLDRMNFENDVKETLGVHYEDVIKFVLSNSKLRVELQENCSYFERLDIQNQAQYAVDFVYDKFVEHHKDVEMYKPDIQTHRQAQSRGYHR